MRHAWSRFAALILAGVSLGCDSPMTPDEANVEVITAADHVVEVVSHEGSPFGIEVTVPFTIHNRSRARVDLAINCFEHLWAFVFAWDGEQYSVPVGLENRFVPDCGGSFITIEPGGVFESSVTLSGPLPSSEAASPFEGSYRVVVEDLFAGSVAEGGPDLREALLLPEEERASNSFELQFEPQ